MMRHGSLLDWSRALNCGPDDLVDVAGYLVGQARAIEAGTIRFRSRVHEAPDRDLDAAVMRLERSACDVTAIVEDLHREVMREIG